METQQSLGVRTEGQLLRVRCDYLIIPRAIREKEVTYIDMEGEQQDICLTYILHSRLTPTAPLDRTTLSAEKSQASIEAPKYLNVSPT